jgi:putative ABC transport system substrate-binding protein
LIRDSRLNVFSKDDWRDSPFLSKIRPIECLIASSAFLWHWLIAVGSGILLYSDLATATGPRAASPATAVAKQFRVALVQHASQVVLDDGARGVLEALAERGYSDGGKLLLRRYNAEADLPTANSIAKDVVSGGNDLIITVSTLSMQTVANANKFGSQTPHVFGLVSDPYSAGVGINRTNHLDHPPYLAGYGSIQPVAETFRMAKQMRPELKTVGLVWNPTESNSEAQTRLARSICPELGITLIEANAENSIAVAEAASSLTARGAEALLLTGDVTVMIAADAVIAAAKRARIPVFSVIPPTAKKGALFDLGANYYEIGKATGNLAADVLEGRASG